MNFHRPGISEEFLFAAGVHLVEEPEPQLRIPYYDLAGHLTGHWRSRLLQIRPDGQKYDQPSGSGMQVYFTHLVLSPGDILYLTEGEFKALALRAFGYAVIGLPGLHCYTKDANNQPQLLPALWEAVRFVTPKEIFFVGDSDTHTNLEFFRSAQVLARNFRSLQVKLLQLPLNGPKGVDDLIGQLDGQFPSWWEEARSKAFPLDPDESFLFPARVQLKALREILPQLSEIEQEYHFRRLIQMAALAQLAKDETRDSRERFCEVAQKVSRLTKPVFQDCVTEEIDRICGQAKETTSPEGAAVASFMETVEPWPEPVEGRILFENLKKTFRRFIVATEDDYHLAALKVFESYLLDCFGVVSLFRIRSPEKRCGKSTLIDVLERLVLKPLPCITVTVASLFRLVERFHPSFLVDEAETFGKLNDDLRAFACAAYERGRKVPRTNPNTLEVELFETFSWILLASIGPLDGTIEDRAVTIFLKRKPRNVEVEELCDVDPETFVTLKRQVQRWCKDHIQEIRNSHLPRPAMLIDRNWKKWRGPLSISHTIDERCVVESLAVAIRKTREFDEEPPIQIEILSRLRDLFRKENKPFLSTTEILRYLNSDPEAPWADWTTGLKKGLTAHRLGSELREHFQVKSVRPGAHTTGSRGYLLKDLEPYFNMLPPEDDPPKGSGPQPPEPPSQTPNSSFTPSAPEQTGLTGPQVVSLSESENKGGRFGKKNPTASKTKVAPLTYSDIGSCEERAVRADSLQGGEGEREKRALWIPTSIPPVLFCTATHPERLLFLDIETFYPWPSAGDYPQPKLSSPGLLAHKERRREAHPYAKDPRRCALRFLTVQCGDDLPVTHDMMDGPIPDSLRDLIANSTVVGHNLDFDISVLRRYGISVSSSIIDTMIAARLLGLGKEKVQTSGFDDEIDVPHIIYGPPENPADNSLDAVALRYLGIPIDKKLVKLGNSDWGVSEISDAQHQYMRWDVEHLPALWAVLKKELENAGLYSCFTERMEFFPHLNQIKMTGIPVKVALRDSDREAVSAFKTQKREELREMFKDYRPVVPKSRRRKIKIQTQDGKLKSVPIEETEEFSPHVPTQVIAALALHGIQVENAQKTTLSKIDAPECRLLLEYAQAKTRLAAIEAICKSTFDDSRVRAAGWNQLAARTGRLHSVEPNLQNIPKAWRIAFQVKPPWLWLKVDLSQIEMYIAALIYRDEALIKLLDSGKDVYVEVAARIFGLESERGGLPHQVSDTLRSVTKALTLGISYGLTIYGFIRQIEDDLGIHYEREEAERFFETFFKMFPQIAAAHAKAAEDALTLDSVRTVTGQRRFLPPLLADDDGNGYWPSLERRKRVIINTPVQGGQANLLIRAVNKFMPRLPSCEVETLNLVHDEVNFRVTPETLPKTVAEVGRAFDEAFRELYGTQLKVKLDYRVGSSWANGEKYVP